MKKKARVRHEMRGSTIYAEKKSEGSVGSDKKSSESKKSSTYKPKKRMNFLIPPKNADKDKAIEKKVRSNSARKARLNNEEREYKRKKEEESQKIKDNEHHLQ